MTKIKLCGLSRPEDIEAAGRLQPDYIGFVFAPGSPRRVTPQQAADLKRQLRPGISAVGVFVDAPPEEIAALLRRGVIDVAQLHGAESEETVAHLRALTDRPIWRAFRVRSANDVAAASSSSADCVLLDAGSGTGTTFDWSLLAGLRRPYFLAGGLHPDNVAAAVAAWRPYGVDVSTGIETNGVKDAAKMRAFCAAVRKEESK